MDVNKTLAALEEAIRAEVDGHHFYMMAARSTTDDKGQQVFERLAADEVEHARYLQAQYDAIKAGGAPDRSLELGEATTFEGAHPIFSESIKDRIKDAHYEMSALSIGAQLELSAIEFYRKAADEAPDEHIAAFYRRLAEWEKRHYDALVTQQQSLRQDYWSEARFSPF